MGNKLLDSLTSSQQEAVLHMDSPLLVMAGAGSGKTRVITHKIAYLVLEREIPPGRILGVTFTNKAANEMKERVAALIGMDERLFQISTFHSLGLRILRENASIAGFDSFWQVMDEGEQKRVVGNISKEHFSNFTSDDREEARRKINLAKMDLAYPNNPDFLLQTGFSHDEVKIYSLYYKYQRENRRWDYEDLISLPVKLMHSSEEIRRKVGEKYKYILVDEFQDTNPNQYELIRLLTREHQNISVVGDDDQAIYSWRGADLRFLYDFEKDFKNVKIIKLERNYRSTQPILNLANSIISRNVQRRQKTMWTEKKVGNPVYLLYTYSKEDETQKIADLVSTLLRHHKELLPVAILYRINSQSLAFETEFAQRNIPFKILKGQRFFDRKEIKDSLALLKLALYPDDNLSFLRIADSLPVGIGDKTLEFLNLKATEQKVSLFEALKTNLPDKFQAKEIFRKIEEFSRIKDQLEISELLSLLLDHSGYKQLLESRGHEDRLLNIQELIGFIRNWEQDNLEKDFNELLDRIGLDSHAKDKEEENSASVFLLTMHNAKGLEFKTVIAAGINQFYMPFIKSREAEELAEERRLFYVTCTRAIMQLIISVGSDKVSPFLRWIDDSLLKRVNSPEEIQDDLSIPTAEEIIYNAEGAYLEHPIFGKGRVEKKIDQYKYMVNFFDRGQKLIDISVVSVNFV